MYSQVPYRRKFLNSLAAASFSRSILLHGIGMIEPEAQPITDNRPSQMSSQTHSILKHTVAYNVFAWVSTLSFCSRLTPAYLFVLGLVEVTMRALHNDSVFEPRVMDHLNCENYWWRNALYINSLYPRREMVSYLSPVHIFLFKISVFNSDKLRWQQLGLWGYNIELDESHWWNKV